MMKKLINITILILISINSIAKTKGGKGIEDIKHVILSDLLILNELSDSTIISTGTIYQLEDSTQGVRQYSQSNLHEYIDQSVKILKIDTFGNYFNVYVHFGVSFREHFMNKDTFVYTVYNSISDFYKINGFIVSDILLLDDFQIDNMDKNLLQIRNWKAFKRTLKRRSPSIASYLKIECLHLLNFKYSIPIFYHPLLRTYGQLNLIGAM